MTTIAVGHAYTDTHVVPIVLSKPTWNLGGRPDPEAVVSFAIGMAPGAPMRAIADRKH